MEGKSTALEGTDSKPAAAAAKQLVKVEASNGARVDLGAKMAAEAFALGGSSSGVSDEQVYRDPAPLKWRIFEVVAKTNGQR